MKKMCTKCGQIKEIQEFYQRKRGSRAGEFYEKCKNCMKIRGRTYYYSNHDCQLYLAKLRKKKYLFEREKWLEVIKDQPCIDCGVKYPAYVMDFDHRNGQTKIASVSFLARHNTSSFEKIKYEIEKCDLVCANCHRQRTYDRIQKRKNAAVANVVKAFV